MLGSRKFCRYFRMFNRVKVAEDHLKTFVANILRACHHLPDARYEPGSTGIFENIAVYTGSEIPLHPQEINPFIVGKDFGAGPMETYQLNTALSAVLLELA